MWLTLMWARGCAAADPKLHKGSFFPVILELRGGSTRPCLRLCVPLVVTEGQSFRLAHATTGKGVTPVPN